MSEDMRGYIGDRAQQLAEALELQRPLCLFDLESTGTNPAEDRIVQMAFCRISPEGNASTGSWLVNPTVPIPPEATEIHGITDADVASAPTFAQLRDKVSPLVAGADLGGYNIRRFDVPLLEAEVRRAGFVFPLDGVRIVDPYLLWVTMEPRDLAGAHLRYTGLALDGAHDAEADLAAALTVLVAQWLEHEELPVDVDGLDALVRDPSWIDREGRIVWKGGTACIGFGKHQGRSLEEMVAAEPGYLDWMLGKDFPQDTKDIIREAMAGRLPAREDEE